MLKCLMKMLPDVRNSVSCKAEKCEHWHHNSFKVFHCQMTGVRWSNKYLHTYVKKSKISFFLFSQGFHTLYIFNNYTMRSSRILPHSQRGAYSADLAMSSYTTRANDIIVLLYRQTRYFGVVLSSNSLISCSFTLAKRSAILFLFHYIGYEVIAY